MVAGKRNGTRAWAPWLIAAVIIFTYFYSWHTYNAELKRNLVDYVQRKTNTSINIESVELEGWFFFSNIRHGKVYYTPSYANDQIQSLNFTATGNGFFNTLLVSISDRDLMTVGIR